MTPAETRTVFGRRVARERARRGWSLREMAARSGGRLAAATIGRAELGHEVWLSIALTIGDVLGISPGDLFEPPGCGHCDGSPPAGFACPECGRLGGGEVAR